MHKSLVWAYKWLQRVFTIILSGQRLNNITWEANPPMWLYCLFAKVAWHALSPFLEIALSKWFAYVQRCIPRQDQTACDKAKGDPGILVAKVSVAASMAQDWRRNEEGEKGVRGHMEPWGKHARKLHSKGTGQTPTYMGVGLYTNEAAQDTQVPWVSLATDARVPECTLVSGRVHSGYSCIHQIRK